MDQTTPKSRTKKTGEMTYDENERNDRKQGKEQTVKWWEQRSRTGRGGDYYVRKNQAHTVIQPVTILTYMSIPWILSGVIFMIWRHGRRGFVVTSSPTLNLFLTMYLHGLLLVLSYKVSVISFIETPMFMNGDIFLPQLHQNQVHSPDTPSEQRRMDFVKQNTRIRQHLPS